MDGHARTPDPPYYAVIFTTTQTGDTTGYAETAAAMNELAATQDGFLGIESARDDQLGITVSYWRDLPAIEAWREHADHTVARRLGRERFYASYCLRLARVDRADEWFR